ncbi:hypothetical protein OROHE_025831 [Orobanche hederae]
MKPTTKSSPEHYLPSRSTAVATYKSARIQAVVCIPLLDGVVEFGTAERVASFVWHVLMGAIEFLKLLGVEEDIALIQRVKTFFYHGGQIPTNPPRPVLSEQSTSNPPNYTEPRLNSHAVVPICAPTLPPMDNRHLGDELGDGEEGIGSDSDPNQNTPTLPMQLDDMCEDIVRFGSAHDGPNNLNSNYDFFTAIRMQEDHPRGGFTRASSTEMWPANDLRGSRLQPPQNSGFGFPTCEDLEQDNTHYPQTVSTILESQSARWTKYSSSSTAMSSAATSAFSKWSSSFSGHSCDIFDQPDSGPTSQWALKYILFNVPLLHTKSSDPTAARRPGTPPDDLNASHILAERRRREKLNERFIVLRSLVPFVTKTDKASILGDTIEYLKHMRKKIQELEAEKVRTTLGREKMRKMRKEGGGEGVESRPGAGAGKVEVSIIGSDVLVEIQCVPKEGLLLKVMQVLGELGIEVATVQSSISNGVFAAEFRAKVIKNANGTKADIMEVKRSINQIILYC